MARRTAQQVITDLAEMADLMNERTGKVNYYAFSRRSGIPHPTLLRIMKGDDTHAMNTATIQALITAFQITFAQAHGDVPIRRRARTGYTPTDADIELVRRIRALPRSDQDDLAKLVELREQLKDER